MKKVSGDIIYFVVGIRFIVTKGQFSGDNVAQGKPSYQVPGVYCDINGCYNASLAVDGQVDSNGTLGGHCSHTEVQTSTGASLVVDFGAEFNITGIIVANRKPVEKMAPLIGERLRGFKVYCISAGQMDIQLFQYDFKFLNENYPIVVEIPLPSVPSCSGLNISIPKREPPEPTVLTLCEVEAISAPGCQRLQENPNTLISYSYGLNHGSIATYTCTAGYYFKGDNYLACKGWQWTAKPPLCEKVNCDLPSNQPNAEYFFQQTCSSEQRQTEGVIRLPFNCTIQLSCHIGYDVVKDGHRQCLQTGKWSNPDIMCQLVRCSLPTDLPNVLFVSMNESALTDDFVYYGTEIRFKCKKGFKIADNTLSKICGPDKVFIGTNPQCNIVTCSNPGQVLNGYYHHDNGSIFTTGLKNYSEIVKVICNNGYVINSGSTLTCNENGTWDGQTPVCSFSGQDDQNNIGVIVGAAVGGSVLLIVIIAVMILVVRRRKQTPKKLSENSHEYDDVRRVEPEIDDGYLSIQCINTGEIPMRKTVSTGSANVLSQ